MIYRLAQIDDLPDIYDFYNLIIDHQKYDTYGAAWTRDVYPDREYLRHHILNSRFYLAENENGITAAGVISAGEDEIYRDVRWKKQHPDGEISVLHIFAVHPSLRRKGVSGEFLNHIIDETRKGSSAIHLDVLKGNVPAFKLYEKAGFEYAGEYEVFYEDTGLITVDALEYDFD